MALNRLGLTSSEHAALGSNPNALKIFLYEVLSSVPVGIEVLLGKR